jgi:hypothetical protein
MAGPAPTVPGSIMKTTTKGKVRGDLQQRPIPKLRLKAHEPTRIRWDINIHGCVPVSEDCMTGSSLIVEFA